MQLASVAEEERAAAKIKVKKMVREDSTLQDDNSQISNIII